MKHSAFVSPSLRRWTAPFIFFLALFLAPHSAFGESKERLRNLFAAIFQENQATIGLPPDHPLFQETLKKLLETQSLPTADANLMTQLIAEVNKERMAPRKYTRPHFRDEAQVAREEARELVLGNLRHRRAMAKIAPGEVDVLGLSAGGALTAIQAHQLGFSVRGFEARETPSRELLLAVRQGVFDHMALVLGSAEAERIRKNVATECGRVQQIDPAGKVAEYTVRMLPVDPNRAPSSAEQLFKEKSSALVRMREVEEALRAVAQKAGIQIQYGQRNVQADGVRVKHWLTESGLVLDSRTPDIAIDARGAGAGIASTNDNRRILLSPARKQIAVVVEHNIPNIGGAYYRWSKADDCSGKQTLVLSQVLTIGDPSGKKSSWVVTDLSDLDVLRLGIRSKRGVNLSNREAPEYQALLNVVARSMNIPRDQLRKANLMGAIQGSKEAFAFDLQMGLNFNPNLAQGDRVGNGHWIAGGGAALAMTVDRLATLATVFNVYLQQELLGRKPDTQQIKNAISAQQNEVLQSHVGRGGWVEQSILAFFPEVRERDRENFIANYREAIAQARAGEEEGLLPFKTQTHPAPNGAPTCRALSELLKR